MMDENLRRKKAVALRYLPESDTAPRVTAKGSGAMAERMIEASKQHGVPLQNDATLVEMLSKIEINQQIPPELYRVVAEVLSLIYRLEGKGREIVDKGAERSGKNG